MLLKSYYFLLSDSYSFCEADSFKPKCGRGEVVVMEAAFYGRMRLGKCVQTDYGYVGCYKDVLPLADARCSGRRSCEIRIPDEAFEADQN